jgi:hypothetical protein
MGTGMLRWNLAASCDHAQMLAAVKVPVLYTHHFRSTNPQSGFHWGGI